MTVGAVDTVRGAINGPFTMAINAVFPLFMVGTILAMESPLWVTGPEQYFEWVFELVRANPHVAIPAGVAWSFFVVFVDTKESASV